MNEKKIITTLPNGDQLVAEIFSCETKMIAIGIMHDNVWVQDLAVIESAYDEDFNYVKDKFNIYVYANEYSEDYTDKFVVNRTPEEE